jgi:hypothetical protein
VAQIIIVLLAGDIPATVAAQVDFLIVGQAVAEQAVILGADQTMVSIQ